MRIFLSARDCFMCQLPWEVGERLRGHSAVRAVCCRYTSSSTAKDQSLWSFTSSLEGTNQLIKKKTKNLKLSTDRQWENSISQSLSVFSPVVTPNWWNSNWGKNYPSEVAAKNSLASVSSVPEIHKLKRKSIWMYSDFLKPDVQNTTWRRALHLLSSDANYSVCVCGQIYTHAFLNSSYTYYNALFKIYTV